MEILYFQTLLSVAELGSFSRAAERLHLTQSTISRRISALEAHYGHRLLDRDGPNIVPTAAGRLALDKARQIVATEQQLHELLARHDVPTRVELGCSPNFASIHLGRLLAHVESLEVGRHITSSIAVGEAIIEGLAAGRYDVGFFEHCDLPEVRQFSTRDLEDDVVVFISSQTDLPAGQVEIAALREHPIYSCPTCCCTRKLLDKNLASVGLQVTDFARVVDIGDIHVMRSSLLERGGVAFLSRDLMAAELAAGRVAAHTVSGFVHDRRRTVVARERAVADAWYDYYQAASSSCCGPLLPPS